MFMGSTAALFRRAWAAVVGWEHSCGSPRKMAGSPNFSSGVERCESGHILGYTKSDKYICFPRAGALVRPVVVGNRLYSDGIDKWRDGDRTATCLCLVCGNDRYS